MTTLITTLGEKTLDDLGLILPHEHLYVDLKTWDQPGYGEQEVNEAVVKMRPVMEKAMASGVTAIVECSPTGVGRRVDIDKAISKDVGLPVVVPTGIYREPWIPPWAHYSSEDMIYEWMLKELTEGIEETGVRAAWIKLSAGDDGMTETEKKVLRAAARAAKETNALIGSHTIRGRVVLDQLAIIEEVGYTADRFLWIHTQADPDKVQRVEIAKRGLWMEFDAIHEYADRDDEYLADTQALLDAGYGDKLLLSHDQGWHDLTQANIFTHVPSVFVPKMRAAGISEAEIDQLTRVNPFNAFGR
ncbi:MAG: esterase [Anaerolineae bacterium]|nr:esterase [Anaerolineae bacterium]